MEKKQKDKQKDNDDENITNLIDDNNDNDDDDYDDQNIINHRDMALVDSPVLSLSGIKEEQASHQPKKNSRIKSHTTAANHSSTKEQQQQQQHRQTTIKTAILLKLLQCQGMKAISNLVKASVDELSFVLSPCPRGSTSGSSTRKASPFVLKSWIALALTLDGRDKITKLLQYTCRLMAHFYESSLLLLTAVDPALSLSRIKSFRNLQSSLANSRKAYRLGRTIIEMDKLKSIGLGHWILWQWMMFWRKNGRMVAGLFGDEKLLDTTTCRTSTRSTGRTTTVVGVAAQQQSSRSESFQKPPRMHLPRKMSSNIGGPTAIVSSTTSSTSSTTTCTHPTTSKSLFLPREDNDDNNNVNDNDDTASMPSTLTRYRRKLSWHMVKFLYLSFSNGVDDSYFTNGQSIQENDMTEPPPSFWNVCLGTSKLVGLAGFWAADNVSYLYSSGFWGSADDGGGGGGKIQRRTRNASIVAARCYFVAAMSGLLLNLKEFVKFRNGPLREGLDEWNRIKIMQTSNHPKAGGTMNGGEEHEAYQKHKREVELDRLKEHLESVKEKYGAICISLLKSICDVLVFSNNTGIDLHLKYRGKKMNETLHCVCGITSALTVLYNNFPNCIKHEKK